MTQLLILFLIVVGTFSLLTGLDRFVASISISRSLRGRTSLAALFIFTGIGHFLMPDKMVQMLPAFVPAHYAIIYVTGVLEILGAIGLLVPKVTRLSSIALILFLIGVLPANIYAATANVNFGGSQFGPIYLWVRVPFQFFLIGWTYYFGLKNRPQ